MASTQTGNSATRFAERVGRAWVQGLAELGYCGSLVVESLYWLFLGSRVKQTVRVASVFAQMMEIGIGAIPIVALLGAAIGAMLAIQGIYSLSIFRRRIAGRLRHRAFHDP